eukprot:11204359-Lingulodinium_polyedra.AAC.1
MGSGGVAPLPGYVFSGRSDGQLARLAPMFCVHPAREVALSPFAVFAPARAQSRPSVCLHLNDWACRPSID